MRTERSLPNEPRIQHITNGGAAIAVDSSPNSVAPASDRIYQIPPYVWCSGSVGGAGPTLFLFAADGTACTIRGWWLDESNSLWIPETLESTMTYAANNRATPTYRTCPGKKVFVQVTSNTGVTTIAAVIV